MSDMQSFVGRIGIAPDLMSGARIHRPDVVRHREVQDAVDQKGRGLQGRLLPRLERPGQGQRANVLRSDLRQRTMAPAGIITVIAGPAVGGRVGNRRRIETLRQQAARKKEQQREHERMKSLMEVIHGSQSGSLLAQGLQVSHQVVNIVVGVFWQQLGVSLGGRVDRVLDRILPARTDTIPASSVSPMVNSS